jgi:hypothetical protein
MRGGGAARLFSVRRAFDRRAPHRKPCRAGRGLAAPHTAPQHSSAARLPPCLAAAQQRFRQRTAHARFASKRRRPCASDAASPAPQQLSFLSALLCRTARRVHKRQLAEKVVPRERRLAARAPCRSVLSHISSGHLGGGQGSSRLCRPRPRACALSRRHDASAHASAGSAAVRGRPAAEPAHSTVRAQHRHDSSDGGARPPRLLELPLTAVQRSRLCRSCSS